MEFALLSLPYELRISIYELVPCTQGPVVLASPSTKRFRQEDIEGCEDLPFCQRPAKPYPPNGDDPFEDDEEFQESLNRRKQIPHRGVFAELERLLCHGRIQRLHYLSMGEAAVQALTRGSSSREALSSLMDAVGRNAAGHEFDTYQSLPRLAHIEDLEEQKIQAIRREEAYEPMMNYEVWHSELFDWQWSDRDLDLGHTGTVQAVITAS